MAVSCIPESGCCCLFVLFISSFFFLSNFQTLKFFVTHFAGTVRPRRLKLGTHVDSGQMYGVYRNQTVVAYSSLYFFLFFLSNFQTLKFFVTLFSGTVRPRRLKLCERVYRGQMYRVYRNKAAAAAYLSLYSVFFLSNFQTLKIFVTLFSATVSPRRLRLGAHVDNRWMYREYRNQAAAAYLSLYFFNFLSLQFSNIKIFVTLFTGTMRPRRLKLGTHVDRGQMYGVYRDHAAALIRPSISSFFFLSNFQTLKCFITIFSGTVRLKIFKLGALVDNGWMYRVYQNGAAAPFLSLNFFIFLSPQLSNINNSVTYFSGLESLNLVHMWTMGACIVYTGIRLLLLIFQFTGPFFFLSNLQICLSPLIAL